jgi:hypothetical protein
MDQTSKFLVAWGLRTYPTRHRVRAISHDDGFISSVRSEWAGTGAEYILSRRGGEAADTVYRALLSKAGC